MTRDDLPELALDDVTVGYEAHRPIVSGLNATFSAGSMTAMCGPSGCGKSSLLFVAGLLLAPWSGAVRVCGYDYGQSPDRVRSRIRNRSIGFVFQDAVLDTSRTVIDNVLEGAVYSTTTRAAMRRPASDLLARLHLDVPLTRRASGLSGGQAQRIALCRALLRDPPVILADEPTGNLDGQNAGLVMDALKERARTGAVVVVATHDQRVVDSCDSVVQV